jgi:phage N-6-adenine-methyltransferase
MTKTPARMHHGDLALYDPDEELKTIVISEAAEKHYERALRNEPDDPLAREQYLKAIATKIKAQADYLVFRDAVVVPSRKAGIAGPGRGKKGQPKNRVSDLKSGLPAADPGGVKAHRWRKRFFLKMDDGLWERDELRISAAIEEEQQAGLSRIEMDKTIRGTQGTGENEWFTPPEYIALARLVLGGIDLDPASSDEAQRIVQATQYFTRDNDGLKHEWRGRIWLNPPYAQPHIANFASKMVAEFRAGRIEAAIMLTHNYTDTEWFHELAGCAHAICFTRGRVKFYCGDEVAAPTQGQAFFYFGREVAVFAETFGAIGVVIVPWSFEVVRR